MKAHLDEFLETLRDPHDIWVSGGEARKQFKLTRDDLSELGENYIIKESPYERDQTPYRQYPLKDVVALALRKHGEAELLAHFNRRHLLLTLREEAGQALYGAHRRAEEEEAAAHADRKQGLAKRYWYNEASTTTLEGRQSVVQGLKTNMGICAVKGSVWLYTGSHVMFADLMHSFADVANYSYRLLELNRSSRSRDVVHPYGYAPLRYITADRSFVFLGFMGGACPLILGLRELYEAHGGQIEVGGHLAAPAVVFATSMLLEGAAVKAAYREILAQSAKEGASEASQRDGQLASTVSDWRRVLHYLRHGRDVMSVATFTEASSGVLGGGIGLMGLGACWYLQSGVPDVAASVVMASMVCGLSTFLMRKSGTALLGQTLPGWRVKALITSLEAHPAIVNVYDVKTTMIADTVRFKAEVQFDPQAITERILDRIPGKEETNEAHLAHTLLSARLREILPQLQTGVAVGSAAEEGAAAGSASEAAGAVWLFRNNSLFYEALAWELKDAERLLRAELRDFRNVHIDLEPW